MKLRRALQLIVVGAAIAVAWVSVASAPGTAQGEDEEPCPRPAVVEDTDFDLVEPSPAPEGAEARVAEAALVPEEPDGIVMRFGKDRGPLHRKFFVALPDRSKATLPAVGSPLRVRLRPLVREEADNVIDDDEYVASATFTGEREVTVAVCIDPHVDPGTYKGTVTLEHPQIRPVAIPVEVSLQYPEWAIVAIAVAVVVVGAAPAYVWATRRRSAAEGGHVLASVAGLRELASWVLANFVAFGIASIAATSAWLANYWYDPSWGAEMPKDWFTLIGATFTAFTTGMLTGTAPPKTSTKEDSGEAPEPAVAPGVVS
ncbi:MAG TPA: hypothetical protein VHN37_16345 [Actinomycetota bacterium]|nr:hypothetical protein [Actinomycetota bacterium]